MIMQIFFQTVKIIFIVSCLMILVEFLHIKYKKTIEKCLTKNKKNQIIGASLLGAVPGCFDAFFVDMLYMSGAVGFGALVAVMLSTAGDEAFVMIAMMPKTAFLIFGICFIVGIAGGFLADFVAKKIKLKRAKPIAADIHKDETAKHFFSQHVPNILKKHIPKLFLWVFFSLLLIEILMQRFDLASILPQNILFVIIIAALLGIIPESGPHLIFLTLFAEGLIPFSVLLTSSIVQDGHGMLPLLSYSIRDSVNVKIFNVVFGLMIGISLFLIGI